MVPTGLDESCTWPFFIAVNITSSAPPAFAQGVGFYCGKRENTAKEKLPGINVRTQACTSCAPVKKKGDPSNKKVIMRCKFPHIHREPNRHLTTLMRPSANQIHLTWSICLLTSLWFLFLITLSNCTKAWVLAVTSLLAI